EAMKLEPPPQAAGKVTMMSAQERWPEDYATASTDSDPREDVPMPDEIPEWATTGPGDDHADVHDVGAARHHADRPAAGDGHQGTGKPRQGAPAADKTIKADTEATGTPPPASLSPESKTPAIYAT